MSLIDDIRNVLEGAKGRDDSFTARCPAHDDRASSLSVRLSDGDPDGAIAFKCFTGCERDAIVDALKAKGVKFEGRKKREVGMPSSTASLTRKLRFDVRDAKGRLLAFKERHEEKRNGLWKAAKQEQRWYQPDGTPGLGTLKTDSMLYRLEVLADNPGRVVVLTEGERKADDLAKIGVTCALGLVGGANNPPAERVLRNLEGRRVYLWPDNDEPGRKLMAKVRDRLLAIAEDVLIVEWTEAPEKGDASDFVAKGNGLEALDALMDEAEARGNPKPSWARTLSDGLNLLLADLDRRAREEPLDVAKSGLDTLDRYMGGGFRRGEVYLVGAPTGGGKTTLLQSFAINAATGDPDRGIAGKRVLLVTPEMSMIEMGRRALAREIGGIPDVWGQPKLVEEQCVRPAARLMNLPIFMAEKPDITIGEVFAEAKRLMREPGGLGLVLVDYAQHVVSDEDARRPRYLAVGDVMTGCIDIAKKLDVPVVLASQVNYISEGPGGKPDYTFRESAKLEHGSTVTLIFDRREPYVADETTPEREVVIDAKILCKKNRLGIQFGRILVRWDKAAFLVTEDGIRADPEPRAYRDPSEGIVTADTPPPTLPPGRDPASVSQRSLYEDR